MSKSNVWNYFWSWRLRRVLQVSVLVSGMFVFSWFLLSFCCAGWRLCWRLLSPGVPVSRYGPVLGTWTLDPARVLSWTHKSPLNIFSPPRQPGPWAAHPMALTLGESWYDTWYRNQERSSISWPDYCHCRLWVLVLSICKHNLTIRPCLINCEWVMKISSILGQNRTNFSSS